MDLLSDIVFHSVYPQAEIDKEVEVICDEIESYNDSPAELIYDEFENILFKGSPLGHNILGTAEQVRAFKTEDALRFTQKLYRPDNAIFFAYGDIDFKKLVKLIGRALADDGSGKLAEEKLPQISQITQISWNENSIAEEKSVSSVKSVGPKNYPSVGSKNYPSVGDGIAGQTIVMQKNTHQAHVMIGTWAYDVNDDRRMPLYLLNNMLGGPGMNAKLNLALREHNGLVYTVESTMVAYGDTGTYGKNWSVSTSTSLI